MISKHIPLLACRTSVRRKHFLANVPLKKRNVEGKLDAEQFKDKPILLYYSAGWCGQCKTLTPKIKKFYEGLGSRKDEIEVVWISNDKEETHQMDYYKKMPDWAYIPFESAASKKSLSEKFNAEIIPALKVVNKNGKIISERARAEIEEFVKKDPATALDNWKAKI